jgi:hypothetical protein
MSVLVSEKIEKCINSSDKIIYSEEDDLGTDEFIVEFEPKKYIKLDPKKQKEQDILTLMGKVSNKIYDVINFQGQEYYLDKDFNLIFDEHINVIGIIQNKKHIFWSEFNKIIEKNKIEDICLKNIIKEILL